MTVNQKSKEEKAGMQISHRIDYTGLTGWCIKQSTRQTGKNLHKKSHTFIPLREPSLIKKLKGISSY